MENYTNIEFIERGRFATVLKAFNSVTKRSVALKKMWIKSSLISSNVNANASANTNTNTITKTNNVYNFNYNTYLSQCIEREIQILQAFHHENIIRFHCKFQEDDYIILVLEYMNIDLHQLLVNIARPLTRYECQNISRQLLTGLQLMHDHEVIHRDLKPDNILFNLNGVLKIADFGQARFRRQQPPQPQSQSLSSSHLLFGTHANNNNNNNKRKINSIKTAKKAGVSSNININNNKKSATTSAFSAIVRGSSIPLRQKEAVNTAAANTAAGGSSSAAFAAVAAPTSVGNVASQTPIASAVSVSAAVANAAAPETGADADADAVAETGAANVNVADVADVADGNANNAGNNNVNFNDHNSNNNNGNSRCGSRGSSSGGGSDAPVMLTNEVGTRWYKAPELLYGTRHYSYSVDVWSAGCIIVELVLQKPLFAGETDIDQLCKIFNILGTIDLSTYPNAIHLPDYQKIIFDAIPAKLFHELFPKFAVFFNENREFVDLLRSCLEFNTTTRITATDALNHPWFGNGKSAVVVDDTQAQAQAQAQGQTETETETEAEVETVVEAEAEVEAEAAIDEEQQKQEQQNKKCLAELIATVAELVDSERQKKMDGFLNQRQQNERIANDKDDKRHTSDKDDDKGGDQHSSTKNKNGCWTSIEEFMAETGDIFTDDENEIVSITSDMLEGCNLLETEPLT